MEETISESIMKEAQKQMDIFNHDMMEFLRSKGFRPKNTFQYVNGLKARLKKKGLEVVCIHHNPNSWFVVKGDNIYPDYHFDIRKMEVK